jgi:hypothetical protein
MKQAGSTRGPPSGSDARSMTRSAGWTRWVRIRTTRLGTADALPGPVVADHPCRFKAGGRGIDRAGGGVGVVPDWRFLGDLAHVVSRTSLGGEEAQDGVIEPDPSRRHLRARWYDSYHSKGRDYLT